MIRRVHAGGRCVDPGLAADALTMPECPLTRANWTCSVRYGDPDIPVTVLARRLHLPPGTVRNHLTAIVSKLGVACRAEPATKARDNGWL